jgi:hypothetical protein
MDGAAARAAGIVATFRPGQAAGEAMRVDRRLLGWGAFFILVGAIPLLVRARVLDDEVVRQWPSLWPLLLIGWGLGLILRRTPVEWIGGALSAIVFGIMGGGALATGFNGAPMFGGCGGDAGGASFATQQGSLTADGQLNVEFNCGELAMSAVDGQGWTVSGTGRGPNVVVSGSTVTIEQPGGSSFFADAGESSWLVEVPRSPVLGLGATLNAGSGTASLDGATLGSANLTVNAGSFVLDLANAASVGDVNATVNLGSATVSLPAGGRSVGLSLNAGSLTTCFPSGAPIRVQWSGALGSNDLEESGLVKLDDDTWTSPGLDETQPHTELRVSANAGSFELSLGTCGG